MYVPKGPKRISVTGNVTIKINTGLKKYCSAFGMIFSNAFVTYFMKMMLKIIGKNELEYVVSGRLKPRKSKPLAPLIVSDIKVKATVTARYSFTPN